MSTISGLSTRSMIPLNDFVGKAVAPGPDRVIAGCVMAAYHNGKVSSKCFGTESVDPASPRYDRPISMDTTMWIASCTKLATAVAVMQCVEKNLLSLDDEVSKILTDRPDPSILVGFDDASGEPILKKTTQKINLRMLLTHQSGMAYDFASADLKSYVDYLVKLGKLPDPPFSSQKTDMPLLFEPGTRWEYGVGTDVAGLMVEKVTGQRLGTYMQQHIFHPLGMESTTFSVLNRPDIADRRLDTSLRLENGAVAPSPSRVWPDDEPADCGGGGLFSSPSDYFKFLTTIAKNDGTLLTPESMNILFQPCLPELPAQYFQKNRSIQDGRNDDGNMPLPPPSLVDYAIGGMIAKEGVPGGRSQGSMSWGGLPNLHWIIDRASGRVLFFASQIFPPQDKETQRIIKRFEAAVYSNEFFET